MKLKFIVAVATVLVGLCADCSTHPNPPESVQNETSTTVEKNDSWGARNFQDPEEGSSYRQYEYGETSQEHRDTSQSNSYYGQMHYDHEPQVHLLLDQEKEKFPPCHLFHLFSAIAVILLVIILVNCLISAKSLLHSIDNVATSITTNTITNTNTDNNMDINDNTNYNYNENVNINDVFGRQFDFYDDDDDDERSYDSVDSCDCRNSTEDSWLLGAPESLQGVWTVAQDFLSENHECASRMACEVASSFVPSSVSPLLAVLPSTVGETRSLLLSAAAGDCAVTYDKCPISLASAITPVMQWL
ncbi:uncharacterized protein LOC135196081 [Macrobrachium nipponense]|uniref:uncharacterized protein LOC135196081 n=1 Tax=Macrobrachium nipponense TaxID=159736 RepID=UPI0030C838AB